jgi:hypothetical protein
MGDQEHLLIRIEGGKMHMDPHTLNAGATTNVIIRIVSPTCADMSQMVVKQAL